MLKLKSLRSSQSSTKTLVEIELSRSLHIPGGLNLHQYIRENMNSNKATDSTLPKSV